MAYSDKYDWFHENPVVLDVFGFFVVVGIGMLLLRLF